VDLVKKLGGNVIKCLVLIEITELKGKILSARLVTHYLKINGIYIYTFHPTPIAL
jgi:hypothetical protein